MINKIKILHVKSKSNKTEDSILYKCWGEREIKFSDKINIIFGQNGCGKTVLLNTIAHYVSIDERGWSSSLTPRRADGWWSDGDKQKTFLEIINESTRLGKIEIDWDGVAAYKLETSRDNMSILQSLLRETGPEEIGLGEAINIKFHSLSAGQNVAYFLGKMRSLKTPDLTKECYTEANDLWKDYGKKLSQYVKTLSCNGKPTLLMDEPDKSLDYESQYIFWDKIVDALAENWQLIIVTHSVFALGRSNDNIIDKDNYFNDSKKLITEKMAK